jgi:hypothetical protein
MTTKDDAEKTDVEPVQVKHRFFSFTLPMSILAIILHKSHLVFKILAIIVFAKYDYWNFLFRFGALRTWRLKSTQC